jgi:cytoskeleton protein RodZ
LPSFGEKLKLEREKRKITLEQISSTTKIGTRMLQALEEEKFTQLPGGIFNKGFVRAYARTLGLDEDQAVADYLVASGEAQPVRFEPGNRENTRDNAARATPLRITDENSGRLEIRAEVASRQLPWGILAVILLIIALGLSLWNYHRRQQEQLAIQSKPAQHAAAQALNHSASSPSALASAPQPAPLSEPMNSSSTSATSLPAAPAGSSQSEATPSAAAPAPGEFDVVIRARDESWLSVFVDGKPVGSETVEAGDTRTYHGRERITVKAGNAGVLDFRLNGKALPVGGDLGEVKTITIGPAGVVPGTPSALTP